MDILTKERAGKHDYQCFNGGNGAPAANDDDEMPFKIEVGMHSCTLFNSGLPNLSLIGTSVLLSILLNSV